MICPLKNHALLINDAAKRIYTDECARFNCAWFMDHRERCALVVLAESLTGVSQNVVDIKDKMPHEGQFRR